MKKSNQQNSNKFFLLGLTFLFAATLFLIFPRDAEAVSQWARKYQVDCTTCHTSFPRLNHFGEKFMRAGFQWPDDEPDGDTAGKDKVSDNLFVDKVGNWFGARLSLTPLLYKTNSLTVDGETEDSLNIGNSNWLQFFVAGTIFKNVSIFIEQEFEVDGALFSWFHLFFTNLADTYVNFQVGKLSPVDFTPFPDRLRMWGKSDVLNVKSSGGKGQNSVTIRQSRPGIQYYGYKGSLLWFAGIDNGKDASDLDRQKNYWTGLRLELPSKEKSNFEGSSVGFHYYSGIDTADSATARIENNFSRYTFSLNARYLEKFDVQAVYQIGNDDNYSLAVDPFEAKFQGLTVSAAYWTYPLYFILQYDQINSDDIPGLEMNKLSPSVWFFMRENFKAGLAARFDLSDAEFKKHEIAVQIRTMF
ncbi:MAG: hypothetical protein GTO17_04435 [Candidatus Aminicenantes bacterium]|nr:hypothetical protein [Candidatus Aminicenantes bacterium]